MPNWCFNNLRVAGPRKTVTRFRNRASGRSASQTRKAAQDLELFSFQKLVPVPAHLLTAEAESVRREWEHQHWGCRGGTNEVTLVYISQEVLVYEFATAWTPPLALIENLSHAWPTLDFELEYDESLSGVKGIARVKAGVLKDSRSDF